MTKRKPAEAAMQVLFLLCALAAAAFLLLITASLIAAGLPAIREAIYDDQALSAMERAMDDMAADLSRTAACAVVRALGGARRVCA